jgi:hypothetical protein
VKEEFSKDMESLKNKNRNLIEILEIKGSLHQIKNTVEGHPSRLEQGEDTTLRLKDKTYANEKTEGYLEKRQKSFERNIQEL